ncbi:hypothetical protein GALL_478860 [mine drainage metagenome]|uniref:Uncharacterized protein n=1 Tax=mine drainage metagenome TaxID=410659 RepID=A0A1J5PGF1_9ZZZZ
MMGIVQRQAAREKDAEGLPVTFQGTSKRGDTYLHTLLIHGARSVFMHTKEPGSWLEQIKNRRPANVVQSVIDSNLGAGRLQTATLRRQINQQDWRNAAQELQRSNGRSMVGRWSHEGCKSGGIQRHRCSRVARPRHPTE